MTELTEQEKLALNRAWCNYDKEYPDIDEMRAMQAGFEAGLEYRQSQLAELEYQNNLLQSQLEHEKKAFEIVKQGYDISRERVDKFVDAIRNYFSAEDKETQLKALIALNEVYDREVELSKKTTIEVLKEVKDYFKKKGETQ